MNMKSSIWILGIMLLAAGSAGATPFSHLYVFGDSLSDAGEHPSAVMSLYKILANNCDPAHRCGAGLYYDGRISNGPVAAEYLADSLFPGNAAPPAYLSYAVAGATSGIGNYGDGGSATERGDKLPIPVPGIFPLPGMRGEVDKYKDDIGSTGGQADPEALFFLWGGSNDYLTGSSPVEAARNIAGYASELADAGARRFFIPNLVDLSKTPYVSVLTDEQRMQAQAFSLAFNNELDIQLNGLETQFPDASIIQFDTYALLNSVIADPAQFGFADVSNPCLTSGPCADPDSFLFWDGFHPTTRGHAILAAAFASAVPEPEAAIMFVTGLLLLGSVSSRSRRAIRLASALDGA
ncbi:PEP-CTERM protein-sorting domain-containing protein [Nitrosovibrio sp. Nv17]|nr:PEP-CTERM protein-sorting domain-containing protein [Nitrosovibrio sp. Nv17]